ncbi:MAG: sugar phosphate nucleotidyltransferase, partial [bacterium]|nr:sugar phosphate nucleotidyltransferase [bacterium]
MQAVVIAAGESSRFWPLNKEHKSRFQILGKPLIYWTCKGLAENDIKEIIVVCGKDSQIPALLGNGSDMGATIFYAYQEKPLGTGNALWQTKDLIRGPFFVVWPGKVNSKEVIAEMRLRIDQQGSECMLVGAEDGSLGYGMVRMKGNTVEEIVEKPSPGQEPSNIKTLGIYFFQADFFSYYAGLARHHETDFIDAINRYIKDKQTSLLLLKEDVPTLKHPWDAFLLMDILFKSSYFKPAISSSARIAENVSMEGQVYIGEN